MAIGLSDAKVLWGRAGARCCNPDCRSDLTRFLSERVIHLGEMAHLIAHSSDGPRGDGVGGDDTYDNLVLLCPTCHTMIDKAPESFPEHLLREWKAIREAEVSRSSETPIFANLAALKHAVRGLLFQNHAVFRSVGPKSEIALADPISDAIEIWELRKADTIIPNNRMILTLLEANATLLRDAEDQRAHAAFREHALAFEEQELSGRRKEFYPTFPEVFGERFG